MRLQNQAIYLLVFFILVFFWGITRSWGESYISIIFIKWICGPFLILLFLFSKLYKKKIGNYQLIALLPIFFLLLLSWIIVPHFVRFGIFPFALLCFLYGGLVIYNSGSSISKSIIYICFIITSLQIFPAFFYLAEESYLTRPLINTIFISNSTETSEYLLGKISIEHVTLLLVFIALSIFIFIAHKKQIEKNQYPKNLSTYSVYFLVFTSFILMFATGPVTATVSEYFRFRKDKMILGKMLEERAKGFASIPIEIKESENAANKVIIIIGESLNKEMMSLYGYPENTTPELIKLTNDSTLGRTYYFTNVISPEVTTVPSLRKVLTNINNHNNLPFEKAVTLVDLFRKAGYETFWISNQAFIGEHDTPNAVISSTAEHSYFLSSQNSIKNENADSGNYFDGELLNVFNDFSQRKTTKTKQVYFIHLLGSHFYYNERYPKEFERFKPITNGDQNCYLNSVFYNDWVVSKFIKTAQEKDFDLVCYFSDHGEDMEKQHNQENYTKSMSVIPFIVYLSHNYAKKQPELPFKLANNKNTPAMTDGFFQDVHTLFGLKSSLHHPSESFLNKEYKIRKRKVVDNQIPFD
jgi:heptose-I-phosphate ethanolaminephosphotransferase